MTTTIYENASKQSKSQWATAAPSTCWQTSTQKRCQFTVLTDGIRDCTRMVATKTVPEHDKI